MDILGLKSGDFRGLFVVVRLAATPHRDRTALSSFPDTAVSKFTAQLLGAYCFNVSLLINRLSEDINLVNTRV